MFVWDAIYGAHDEKELAKRLIPLGPGLLNMVTNGVSRCKNK
jgi:hypothetical protein